MEDEIRSVSLTDTTNKSSHRLDKEIKALLASVSTATLHTQLFKRGFRNTSLNGLLSANAQYSRFVGEAFTLRYIPAREDLDSIEIFADPDHPQRKAIEIATEGDVLVMDCRQDARAASAGSILVARMMKRGLAGLVTDAAVRDYPIIRELPFPVFSNGPNPAINLVHHHAVDMQVPIACAGVAVYPRDVVVADAEGVIVIPRHLAESVAQDAAAQEHLEEFLYDRIASGMALPGTYPPDASTLEAYEAWRSQGSDDRQ